MKITSFSKVFFTALLMSVFMFFVSSSLYANNPQEKQSKKEVKTEKQMEMKDTKSAKEETKVSKNESESLICVVSGEEADPSIKMDYKGKTYYFCCKKCLNKFNSNPEKYIKSN
ncbi:MAG: YHS domain-containing protein [Ignavibacteria bacterium]